MPRQSKTRPRTAPLPVVRTKAALRTAVAAFRKKRETVALVPTMGALHAGHLALVAEARKRCDRVVVSVFVNPTQFGPNEDFGRYPRDLAADRKLLAAAGADLVFAPTVAAMYPDGFATTVAVEALASDLDGRFRPGHFTGVATVVAKLLAMASPDAAVFGEKDYQQLAIVRRLVRDLDLPVAIVGIPTVREADGLALSSRNAYLTSEQRRAAPALHEALSAAAREAAGDFGAWSDIAERATRVVRARGFDRVDYLELRDAETLGAPDPKRPARVLAAAWLGATRLIDNVPVPRKR
ncbi:MAG TPA: pantoate--beta-alanine ligase [Alphaproteobacteria bacterium]|nr:pantoate--beta-alanine ligase [Alphaproteobacteria bacterium]